MKLVLRDAERLVFAMGPREKTLLERLLAFYPMRPDDSPTLSREPDAPLADATEWLHTAQREQRAELGAWIHRQHGPEGAFRATSDGWHLSLTLAENERLLQILNDLRVGAWTKLGCPENLEDPGLATAPSQAPLYMIMTLAGQFQAILLDACRDDDDDDDPAPAA